LRGDRMLIRGQKATLEKKKEATRNRGDSSEQKGPNRVWWCGGKI